MHPGTKSGLATEPGHVIVYEVRVEGHLESGWANWFGGLAISRLADGDTILVGPVVDQAALHSILRRVRDLGLSLVSLRRLPHATG